ncbi:cytochrome B [Stutzerimonas balearica]|jgi:cytochrome b|uniref:cytochrome b/b6 domain-containing protein n=1 Tax=Stutzerimonas balearica TaxID=74829 RepID=UPI000773DDD1|nr:cytochrome b/b6 domain-containing protein [Stutzerimonas balearica]OMG67481.1 cytochrome B [Stutzerimonas balearica]
MSETIRLWDLPLRAFHWLFATAVTAAIVTGWLGGGLMVWHGRLGLLVLGLLVFRLVWGLCGSTYARWSRIFAAAFGIRAYLRGSWQEAGHNPLGSLSVLAMLLLVGFQVGSGLVATDDIAFQGPLNALVGAASADLFSGLHRQAKWLLLALIGLHLLAILYYTLVRRLPLVGAMLNGCGRREHPAQRDAEGGSWIAAIAAVLLAVAVVWTVQSVAGWMAPPPAAPAPALDW